MSTEFQLAKRITSTAFAFRGYNVVNLGRTPELLEHPVYGPVMGRYLAEASELAADVLAKEVDLVARVRARRETTGLDTYGDDVAMIVAIGLAQVHIINEFFGVSVAKARMAFGYSLGEVTALIASGVYTMKNLLTVLLALTDDAVELAQDISLGVLFSRGSALDPAAVQRLCVQINQRGQGLIDISAFLSPNSLLLLGQKETLGEFQKSMRQALGGPVQLKRRPPAWVPMHTLITRERALADRSGAMLNTTSGGMKTPVPHLISGVTGKASYNDFNSRELLHRWTDHPQQLWSMIHETLASGVEAVIHVGPAPNIIPATFKRISEDVRGQLHGFSPSHLGLRTLSQLARRPWLAQLLPTNAAALLRAPYLQQVILEDWLLAQKS